MVRVKIQYVDTFPVPFASSVHGSRLFAERFVRYQMKQDYVVSVIVSDTVTEEVLSVYKKDD